MNTEQVQPVIQVVGNTTALAAFGGWLVGILPPIATGLTAIWFAILITEKVTGKKFHELVFCALTKIHSMLSNR